VPPGIQTDFHHRTGHSPEPHSEGAATVSRAAWLRSQQARIQELIYLCEISLAVAASDSHGLIRELMRELELLRDGKKIDFNPVLRRTRIDLEWNLPFFRPLGKFLDDMDKAS